MTSDIPHPIDARQAEQWLKPVAGELRYALEHDRRLIGGAGTFLRDCGAGELGFWLGSAWWGQGFATEAARAVLAHAVVNGSYAGFSSSHFDDNPASRRVLDKLGFEAAGTGQIWSLARSASVEAHWVWLSREKAAMLYGHDAGSQIAPARSRWRALTSRLVRTN